MKNIWFLILLAALAISCTHPDMSGFKSMKWESVDSLTDSTTMQLERMFYDVMPAESIVPAINRLKPDNLNHSDKNAKERMARWLYWRGRLMKSLASPDSARWYLRRAAATVDSNAYNYTYRRIMTMLSQSEPSLADLHLKRLLDDLSYYSEIGDHPMVASVSILIAHALSDSYQPDTAIDYFQRADSINCSLGLTAFVAKNRINRAACLRSLGEFDKSMVLIDSLLNDSIIIADFFTYNTVLRNAYIYTKDVKYLQQGYDGLMRRDSTLSLNGVFEYFLSKHYMKYAQTPDTTLSHFYTNRAFARLGKVNDPEIRAAIFQIKAEQMEHLGHTDSAYLYLKKHLEATDTFNIRKQPAEVARIQNMKTIAKYDFERNETYHLYTLRLLILALIVMAVGTIAIVIIIRIRERHKSEMKNLEIVRMQSELDIERYQKQVLAISLSMEETDRKLSEIRERFKTLREVGKVSADEMREIDSVIKSHLSNRDDLKQFIELFEKAHPHFISNMKTHHPDLSESQMKLAVYVYTGMSNKQIATYLNIRTESVKQARWRLRQKMGLSADESLEDALHALGR